MYKMLSVCLALSFGFITAETSTINQIEKKSETTEVKKPRVNTGVIDIDLLESKPSETTTNKVVKKLMDLSVKNKKSNEPDKRSGHQKEEKGETLNNLTTPNVIETNMEIKVTTQEEEIDNEKLILQAKKEEDAPRRPEYIQGPRKTFNLNQSSRLTREHETLFFSEYAEPNGGNHKYLEIYNGTGSDVDLYNYLILGNNNGKVINDTLKFPMGTIVSNGDVYVIAHESSSTDIIAEADTLIANPYTNDPAVSGNPDNFICSFNGDDVRVLAHIASTGDTVIVDQLGILDYDGDGFAGDESLPDDHPNHGGDDPGSGFPVADDSNGMKDQTLIRKSSVFSGNGGDWFLSAGTDAESSEWILENPPTNTYSPTTVGSHEVDGPYLAEDFEGTFPPNGWTTTGDFVNNWAFYGDAVWQQGGSVFSSGNPSSAASGSYYAYFYDYGFPSNVSGSLVSSDIDLTSAVDPRLKFQYYDAGGSDFVDIQVSNADGSFSSVGLTPASTVGWELVEVSLSAYVGQTVSIRFVGVSVYGSSNPSIDDLVVEEPPTFPIAGISTDYMGFGEVSTSGPLTANFAITNSGGGDLTATASSTNSKFVVAAIPGRIAPDATVAVGVTYTPTAAVEDSGFVIITHNGDSSPDTIEVFGSGTLDLLSQGFDEDWVGTPSAPLGWSQISVSGPTAWRRSTSFGGTAYGAYSSSGGEHVLISPVMDLTAGYNLFFSLDGSTSAGTDLKVQISSQNTDATTGWTDLAHYVAGTNMPATFEDIVINLSAYSGNHYIAFRLLDADGYSLYLDDVSVEAIPTVASIELSTDDVDFGSNYVSSSLAKTVNVSNVLGGAAANLAIVSSNSKFVPAVASQTIAAGGSFDLSITYTPTEVADDSGYVVLTHEGASSPDTIEVFGSGNMNLITEGFDEDWVGTPGAPEGWSQISVSGTTPWERSASYGGTAYGRWTSAGGEHVLISPVVDITAGYNLLFSLDGSTSAGTDLKVQISSQNTDATTGWTDLAHYVAGTNMPSTWEDIVIDLGAYTGNQYIAFRLLDADGYSLYLDDVIVEPKPTVTILSLSTLDLTMIPTMLDSSRTATIGVSNAGSGDLSGTITYTTGLSGPAAFTNTDNSVDVAFTGTQLGSFSGSVYFASNGGNDTVDVSTVVGKSVATWDDDFDNDGESDWPVGWEVAQVAQDDGTFAGSGWSFYSDGGHSGQGYTSADAGGYLTVNEDWLISPIYQVVAGDSVSFYASDDGGWSSYPDIMTVHVSPTASTNPSTFTVELDSVANMGGSWVRYAYDLSAYVGTDVRIAIVYRGEWGYALNVDDVVGPTVIAPTGPVIYEYPMAMDFSYGDTHTAIGNTDTVTFDYINNGGADLEVSAVTFVGPFSLSSQSTMPITTVPGTVGAFDVVFTPVVDSLYIGSMTVTNNTGEVVTVALSGRGFDGIYREGFGIVGADGNLNPWSEGWIFSDDGVRCPTDQPCTNATGDYWRRASLSGNGLMYHSYATGTDADTTISGPIVLPALADGFHYELDTEEYIAYGGDANDTCGIAISTDAGATFTLLGQANYGSLTSTYDNTYDLTGYAGDTVHFALVYQGTYANAWGVSTMEVRKKEDPVVPIFAHTQLVFPVTALNESVSRKVYYQNVGVGVFFGDITYPASMTGPASIANLVPGTVDSMIVTYTPSTPGIETGDITIDGTASNGGMVSLGVEANAGELAFDMETQSAGWQQYSLGGQPWVAPSGAVYSDTWTWFGGTGHSGPNYYGVYSYGPYWGGVDDYLVSPRYSLSDASEVISFYASGGDNTERDSLNVWVSTERPQMGFTIGADGMRVDTGFVNTSAFTMAYESLPTNVGWEPVNVVLPTDQSDVWVMIHSVQHYKEDGTQDGWMLKVDDLGTPKIYENPLPVLRVGTRYDFGVTNPDGDSVKYFIRNTGLVDLVIDSMNFDDGMYFDVEYANTYPITIVPGGVDSIQVFWMPEMEGRQTDTLRYFSNYTVGEFDAFGFGTDHSVFTADAFNAPPGAVMLLTPDPTSVPLVTIDANNATGSTDFYWTNTTDPDGTPIEYIFEIMVPGDTLDTLLSSNSFSLDHSEVVELMEELSVTSFDATWDVHAYDGFEATGSSNGPWALSFDAGWVLGGLDNNTIPDVFALHNNYPNPFNPVTNIRYDIPVASDVRIDIYNIAGEKVRTLVSREHQPGRYKIQWNATNEFGSPVATGMYIYKIHAKDFVSVKKLLLMK